MPELDDRLRDALRGAARVPDRDAEDVAAAVTVKHRRRRVRRRAAAGLALATVVTTAVVTTVVVIDDRGADDVQVATNQTAPPPSTTPPPTSTTVPPEAVETAQEEVVAAAPAGYDVEPVDVTVVTPDEAVVTITDATGTTYQGVRFAHDATGWNMVPASTCRLPDADPVACATVEPEVRFTPGRRRLDSTAYGGAALPATALAVDPNRYVEGPLISAGRLELAAAYERAGTGRTVPPSYVVGFPPDATTGSVRADLEGEILSFADGGSVVWAVTHDLVVDSDRVEYRLKRIDTATGRLTTMPLPPGAVPAGPVAASESGAWVPVRDGVIPFAPDGAALTRFALPEQETRNVAVVDGQVYATAGTTIRRLGENGNAAAVVLDTGGPDALTGLVATDTSVWALAGNADLLRLSPDLTAIALHTSLPQGMRTNTLHADAKNVWATGFADLVPATDGVTQSLALESVAALIDDAGVSATLVIAGTDDADVLVGGDGLVLTSGGTAYRVTLPE